MSAVDRETRAVPQMLCVHRHTRWVWREQSQPLTKVLGNHFERLQKILHSNLCHRKASPGLEQNFCSLVHIVFEANPDDIKNTSLLRSTETTTKDAWTINLEPKFWKKLWIIQTECWLTQAFIRNDGLTGYVFQVSTSSFANPDSSGSENYQQKKASTSDDASETPKCVWNHDEQDKEPKTRKGQPSYRSS